METSINQDTSFVELGSESVKKLLLKYSWPAIVSMVATSLYNMADSIFIGQGVGALAISGLAICSPFMNLSVAFGTLIGVGASTLISVTLGQRNYDKALKVFGNSVMMNLIWGVLFSIIGIIFLDPILYFFGASNETLPYAHEYMFYILVGNIFSHTYMGLNAVFRSAGHPQKAMYATIGTVILNIILDPIFIFVFDMGIKGAAIATVIAQLCALVWQFFQFNNEKEFLHFQKGIYKLNRRIIGGIFSIGLSPFLMNAAACLVVILINNTLKKYGGDLAIGAYGINNRILFLFVMIVIGFTQGMQPIVGYNFGAKKLDRVMETLKRTIVYGVAVTFIAWLVAEFIPQAAVALFTHDKELIDVASHGFRIMSFFFFMAGAQMVIANFFQSMGMVSKSIFISLTRQLLLLIPFLLILPRFFSTDGVWISIAAADILSTIIAIILLILQLHKFQKTLK